MTETKGNPVVNALLPGGGAFDRSRLKGLRNDVPDDKAAAGAKELAKGYQLEQVAETTTPAVTPAPAAAALHAADPEPAPPPAPKPVRRPATRPRSPVAPHIEMPLEGEEVEWDAHLRCDFPAYVYEQIVELAHRERRTLVSALLKVLAEHVDQDGRPQFFVRPEDLVPDRRKAAKKRR